MVRGEQWRMPGTHPAFFRGYEDDCATGHADPTSTGVPGLTLCRNDHPAVHPVPHNVIPGSLGERDAVCCSGYEAGRRRAIGVVAALQSSTYATHADGATLGRWDAKASQRPRRPVMRTATGTASASVDAWREVGDCSLPLPLNILSCRARARKRARTRALQCVG